MSLQDVRDLLEYDLSVLLDAERKLLQMMPLLAQESKDIRIRDGFTHHATQTEQQIKNLQQCCRLLHFQPRDLPCQTIAGLQQDHTAFRQRSPAPEAQTLFDLGAALKGEHYEIACYRGLIEKTTLLGQTECADLLRANLSQEEEMARQLEEIAPLQGHKAVAASAPSDDTDIGDDADDVDAGADAASDGDAEGGHTPRDGSTRIVEGSQSVPSIAPPDTLRHPTQARLEEAGIDAATAQTQREEAGDKR